MRAKKKKEWLKYNNTRTEKTDMPCLCPEGVGLGSFQESKKSFAFEKVLHH